MVPHIMYLLVGLMCRSLRYVKKTKRSQRLKGSWILPAAAALVLLSGFGKCPMSMDNTSPAQQDGGASTPTLDIGGSGGAYWNMTYAKVLTVTVRTGTKVATKQVSASAGTVSILGNNISISSFCARADTLCPAALLPGNTMIIQPEKSPWNPLIGFNRFGPLSVLKNHPALIGVLKNDTLKVPMATDGLAAAKGDLCALVSPSAIDARASAVSGGGQKADTLQGTITLAYKADCWNLGGSSAVTGGATVELTVAFTGKRKQGI